MPYVILVVIAVLLMEWEVEREIRKLDRRIAELEKQYGVNGGANGE
jgi:hypothetical protein